MLDGARPRADDRPGHRRGGDARRVAGRSAAARQHRDHHRQAASDRPGRPAGARRPPEPGVAAAAQTARRVALPAARARRQGDGGVHRGTDSRRRREQRDGVHAPGGRLHLRPIGRDSPSDQRDRQRADLGFAADRVCRPRHRRGRAAISTSGAGADHRGPEQHGGAPRSRVCPPRRRHRAAPAAELAEPPQKPTFARSPFEHFSTRSVFIF